MSFFIVWVIRKMNLFVYQSNKNIYQKMDLRTKTAQYFIARFFLAIT